jgi:predicted O-methyltransferase YrrM
MLHLVDPWEHQEDATYHDVSNMPQSDHDENLEHVKEMLGKEAPGRFTVHRGYSVAVANEFKDNQLDFVYIDARHDYEGVLEDLEAWWPKLKVGGLIAGHDYVPDQIKEKEGAFGVQKAVKEFTLAKGRDVQSISDKTLAGGRAEPQAVDGGWTTFYFFK